MSRSTSTYDHTVSATAHSNITTRTHDTSRRTIAITSNPNSHPVRLTSSCRSYNIRSRHRSTQFIQTAQLLCYAVNLLIFQTAFQQTVFHCLRTILVASRDLIHNIRTRPSHCHRILTNINPRLRSSYVTALHHSTVSLTYNQRS